MLLRSVLFRGAALTFITIVLANGASVLTFHNDLNRTGANLAETFLTTTNVNQLTFGKLFSRTVDGQIYAQILHVPALSVPGKGTLNVIFAVTEHNSVYAFDADFPAGASPLWHVNLGTPILCAQIPYCDRDLLPEIGITSTPVIDPASSTIYVVAETWESGKVYFRLHALDLLTGSEKPNSPVTINATVPGSGAASVNGRLAFDPFMHWQRAGLLLYNNTVYIGFGSHQDSQPYHGWMFGYNATTLQQTAVQCLSPNADSAGVWQSGAAPAVDASGNIYVQTGHGTLTGMAGGDFGISMVKLRSSDLKPVDFFAPSNQHALSDDDNDFGSSAPLLIPGTNYAVGGGKDGKLFLIDTSNMGQYDPLQNHVAQYWQATYSLLDTGAGGIFGGNVWYNNTLYMWGRRDALKAFSFNGSRFQINPSSTTSFASADGYSNEPALAVSANGNFPGTGIVWATGSDNGNSDGHAYPGSLHAFDAGNLSRELWNSNLNPARDALGSWAKWVPPTVVNGKVYVPTFDGSIQVYGLLPGLAQITSVGVSAAGVNPIAPSTVNLTTEASLDWIHWGDPVPSRKANVPLQISDQTVIGFPSHPIATDLRAVTWTDGTGVPVSTANTNAMATAFLNSGYTFSAPADGQLRIVNIHVGGANASNKLTAHLTDGSAPDFTDTTPATVGNFSRDYTLQYQAATPGQHLVISWVQTTRTGSAWLNSASLSSGQISGAVTSAYSANLTAEGTLDWIHWGETPVNRKAIAVPLLADIVPLTSGFPLSTYSNDLRDLSWSDGNATPSSSNNRNGIYLGGVGNGFSFTVPADVASRVVRFHVGGFNSSGALTAKLSDGSAAPYVDNAPFNAAQYDRDYTITFRAATPGQTLTLTWIMTGGPGNVTVNGASLSTN